MQALGGSGPDRHVLAVSLVLFETNVPYGAKF